MGDNVSKRCETFSLSDIIFTTNIRNILSKTKPARPTETKPGIYQVDGKCGKSYLGKTKH